MLSLNNPFLLILAALLTGAVISWIIRALVKNKLPYIWFKSLRLHIELLLAPFIALLFGICVTIVYPLLKLPAEAKSLISHGLQLWIIACLGWGVKRFTCLMRGTLLERYNIKAADNLNARRMYTQIRLIEHVLNFIIITITIALMVMSFSEIRSLGVSIFASAGVVSIVLGIAAQKSLGNLLAGIQIAITQPIRLDDVVIVEKKWGWIEEINLTYVVVRIWDLRRLVVPISYFIEKPFQNWTRMSANILSYIYLYTDYSVPVEQLRREFTRLLEKSPYWDKRVNVLQVTDWSGHDIQLRALASAADSSISWNLQCEIREGLLRFLQENYPQALPRTRIKMTAETSVPLNKP